MSRAGSLARAFGSDGTLNIADIGNVAATAVPYSNAVSGISANTVQEAIDYLNTLSSGGAGDVASYTRQKFTATAGQTTFTVTAGYTVGYLQVFMNGILLDVSDYTAADGSTVVLSAAAAANDEIVTIALDSFNIAELLRVTNISASASTDAVTLSASNKLTVDRLAGVTAVHHGTLGYWKSRDNNGGGELVFEHSTSDTISDANIKFRVHSSGNITTAGNVILPSGAGIDFSANGNASGATSEVLDDYETGNWTPSIHGSGTWGTTTYNYVSGRYVKIGRLVYCQYGINIASYSGGSGEIELTGFPFTAESIGGYQEPSNQCQVGNMNDANLAGKMYGFMMNGTATMHYRAQTNTDVPVSEANMKAGTYINGIIFYRTA